MDLDDFRSVLDSTGVDVWDFIDAAISVAASDCGSELKNRRDGIVERLYAPVRCRNCDAPVGGFAANGRGEVKGRSESSPEEQKDRSPHTPLSADGEDEDLDPYGGLFDDEQKRILEIKEQLEEPGQTEDALMDLLQNLADMDITFGALQETDIGRYVNRLRKHPSSEVQRFVKDLVRKWKETVNEWVKLNHTGQMAASSEVMADGDSPPHKLPQNGHHQVPDFAYSPNPNNGSSGSDRNYSEPEPKPTSVTRKEAPPRPAAQSVPAANSASHNRPRDANIDMDRLASASKRLQANYKDAENAKRQRTIQVMDIHEIPKPKNTFFGKNKGGGSHGKRW